MAKPAILLRKLWGSTAWDWVVSSVHGKHVSDGVWEAHWGLTWIGLATPLLVVLELSLLRTSDRNCLKNWPSLILYKTPCCGSDAQLCLTLCSTMDCSPASSSVHEILQARILEWVAIFSSGDLPDPGVKPVSLTSPALAGGFLPAPCVLDSCSNVRCNRFISSLAFFNAKKLAESLHLI